MRTQLCSFPCPFYENLLHIWRCDCLLMVNFCSAKYHAHSSECKEKIRKCQTRMVGILGGQLQQCVIVWHTSEKCSWRSVWEVLKCLRACFKVLNLSNQVSVRSSKGIKRWDCCEKAWAQSALRALQRSTQSDKNLSIWAIKAWWEFELGMWIFRQF